MSNASEARARPRPGAFAVALFFLTLPPFAAGGALGLAATQGLLGALATPFRGLIPRSPAARAFLALLAAFIAWAWAETLRSPSTHATAQAVKLSLGVLCGLAFVAGASVDDFSKRITRTTGVAALFLLIALLMVEAFADMPLNRLAQPLAETGMLMRNPAKGDVVLICLLWGGVASLAGGDERSKTAWRLLLAGVAVLAFQFNMAANWTAFFAGLIAYAIGVTAPRVGLIALSAGLAAWLLAAPWVLGAMLPNPSLEALAPDSWAMRLHIWNFAADQIAAQPLLGHGFDSARTFPQQGVMHGIHFRLIPLHTHSASLQIWLELGAVGAALAAAALIVGGVALAQALERRRTAAAAACGVLASIGLYANVGFGAWQEWWIATAFAAAALVAASARPDEPEFTSEF